jgi:hypothetical protein
MSEKSDPRMSQPYYENWPPEKIIPPSVAAAPSSYVQYLSFPESSPVHLVPPLTPHMTLGLQAKPQSTRGHERRMEMSPGPHDTSLDDTTRFGSRPGSSHSAPMLDVSIDHHYEFDTRTPTDEDMNLAGIKDGILPRQWNRPYLGGYDAHGQGELGAAARLARSEKRVFSDSEIYSPVFPRGRPAGMEEGVDVSARVRAMKQEFRVYKEELEAKEKEDKTRFGDEDIDEVLRKKSSSSSSPSMMGGVDAAAAAAAMKLESLI